MANEELNQAVTQEDVAKAMGLGQATVSRALRQKPGVSESLRQRILATARKLGYRTNASARMLSYVRFAQHAKPITAELAWLNVWPEPEKLRSHPDFELYWRGAFEQAERLGYRLEEFTLKELGTLKRVEQALMARGIQGLLLPPFGNVQFVWQNFDWSNFCAVRMSRTIFEPRLHLVTTDQIANTMLSLQKMRALGYERIGFLNLVEEPPQPRSRHFIYGYLAAQYDRPRQEQLTIFERPPRNTQGHLERWLKRERPDAILADGGADDMIKEAGFRIPEDIGLAYTSALPDGDFAGIYQNPREIGRISVNMVITLIRDNERGIPPIFRQVLVSGRWVDGATLPKRKR